MSAEDRARWDARWAEGEGPSRTPAPILQAWAERLPRSGRALDLASGPGRNALWLAQRGLETTAVDVSPVALTQLRHAAMAMGMAVTTLHLDLEHDPLPPGPWDVVVCTAYLLRELFPAIRAALAPGGWLLFAQPTPTNLDRHRRPSRRFLVEAEELAAFAGELQVLQADADWRQEDRHEAWLVARRVPSVPRH